MADVVKATLYWNSGERYNAVGQYSPGLSPRMTAAQSHDGSDTVYSRAAGSDNKGMWDPAAVEAYQQFTLDTCAVSGDISKVVVTIRARRAGGAYGSATVQPSLDAGQRGTGAAAGTTFADHTYEFTTDPVSGGAWTNTKVNSHKWGWYATLGCACTSYDSTVYADVSEFKVEVYGPNTQQSTPSSVSMAATVNAATGVPGPVSSEPAAVDMTATANAATGVAGLRLVQPASVPMVFTVSPTPSEVLVQAAARDPENVTPLALTVDGSPLLVVLRDRDSHLRDESLFTAHSDAKMAPQDADFTVQCTGLGGVTEALAGLGAISGLVFHCMARVYGEHTMGEPLPTVSNPRWNVAGQSLAFTTPPVVGWGLTGAEGPFADCYTGLVTTKDGVLPWTWADIVAATAPQSIVVHVHATAIAVPVVFEVAEVWAEVMGPVGSGGSEVVLRQRLGAVRRVQPFGTQVTEG